MSWQSVKLGKIFEIARGGSPRPIDDFITEEPDGLNWISIKDASNSGKYISKTKLKIRKEGLSKSRLVHPGDFLLTNSMSFGRPYIMNTTGCIHDGWLVLSGDKNKVNQDYFYHLLGSDLLHKKFSSLAAGAVVKNLNINLVKNVEVPLPPFAEQQKIAEILDAADSLRQKDQQLVERYTALSQSLFLEMFGDPVTNPMAWSFKTIDKLVQSKNGAIKRGPFGGALKKEIFVEDGFLVYEQYHALNNDFEMARYFIDEKKFNELKDFEVNPDDIIISCSGVNLGRLAIVPKNAKKGIINQALLRLSLDFKVMNNVFFTFVFTNQNFKEKYFGDQRGSGVPNFPPISVFKQFQFICPPVYLQNQFAERIQLIEAQKQQAQLSLEKSEALFKSLLQRAFTGELTAKMAA